jgi:hypothetical protein
MKERTKVFNIFLFWVFVLSTLIITEGEGIPIFYLMFFWWELNMISLLLKFIFVIIIINLILLIQMEEHYLLRKILNVGQIAFLILLLIEYFFKLEFMICIMIMLTISLLEMINLLIGSTKTYNIGTTVVNYPSKRYKYGNIIIICLSFLCLVSFWFLNNNISRFDYHLNDDGSYSIQDVKSNNHTIRIPSTYKGKPVISIFDWGMCYYFKDNIEIVIFEENSNIRGYYLPLSNLKSIKLPRSVNSLASEAFHTKQLKEIIIPIEVNRIYEDTFDCENAIIYCEAESKPVGWDKNWCYKAKEIIWGYQG